MARRQGLEQQLAWVASLEPDEIGTAERTRMLEMLEKGHPRLVARTLAKLAQKPGAASEDLVAELFEKHRRGGAESDPGCEIKLACIQTLARMESGLVDTFLKAAAHRQPEPAYGGPNDTAAELRAQAFAALVSLGYREIHYLAVELLHDAEPETRQLVIAAMAHLGSEAAELLLRFKLASGDGEPAVLAECFSSLMQLAPEKTMPLALAYLDDPVLAESAALAIGESHHPDALASLKQHWESHPRPSDREQLILPIALIRDQASRDFLLAELETGNQRLARALFSALSIYRGDDELRARLEAILKKQRNSQWRDYYRHYFGS